MPLANGLARTAPTSSWWVAQTDAEFVEHFRQELPRLMAVPVKTSLLFDVPPSSERITRPARIRTEAD